MANNRIICEETGEEVDGAETDGAKTGDAAYGSVFGFGGVEFGGRSGAEKTDEGKGKGFKEHTNDGTDATDKTQASDKPSEELKLFPESFKTEKIRNIINSELTHDRSIAEIFGIPLKHLPWELRVGVPPQHFRPQRQTPWQHYRQNFFSTHGHWRVFADNRDTTNGKFDRFRYVIGAYYGKQELGDSKYSQTTYFNRNGKLFNFKSGVSVDNVPFELRIAAGLTKPQNIEPRDSFVYREGILKGLGFEQTFAIWAKTGWKEYLDVHKYWHGGWYSAPIDVVSPRHVIELPPLFLEGHLFEDFNFNLNLPLLPKEIDRLNEVKRPLIAKITPDYSFFVKPYENLLNELNSAGDLIESILPNIYVFEFEKQSQNLDIQNSILNQLITLNGHLKTFFKDIIRRGEGEPSGTKIGESDRGDYFLEWPKKYRDVRANYNNWLEFQNLIQKYKNIIIDARDMRLINNANRRKYNYPMYVDLQFTTDRATAVSNILHEANIISLVGVSLLRQTVNQSAYSLGPQKLDFFTDSYTLGPNPSEIVREREDNRNNLVNELEFETWLDNFRNAYDFLYENELRFDDFVGLTSSQEFLSLTRQDNALARSILSIIVKDKISKLVKRHSRTFDQIMDGMPAYSETIAYIIKKIKKVPGKYAPALVPVQTILVPNNSELDIFNYVDTQVAYNNEYEYEVVAQQLVIGSEYMYTKTRDIATEFGEGVFAGINEAGGVHVTVQVRPNLKIFEIPYFRASTKVLDSPPIAPDVNIVPYRGVDDRLLFLFNAQSGTIKDSPVFILPTDEEFFNSLRASRNLSQDEDIVFEGDDEIEFFQIFRTTEMPSSYAEFSDKFYFLLPTESPGAEYDTSSAGFVDRIIPNKKYYYTFRAIDTHGNISNPTQVFEIEMVNNDGAVFPLINVLKMTPKDTTQPSRTFKRFLMLKPNVLQSALVEQAESGNNVLFHDDIKTMSPDAATASAANEKLGTLDESLFGAEGRPNKFKIRITSKRTGKKIDINLNFMHKRRNEI